MTDDQSKKDLNTTVAAADAAGNGNGDNRGNGGGNPDGANAGGGNNGGNGEGGSGDGNGGGGFDNMEKFKIALDARNFEIKMFWQRTNYLLLLNTSAGVAAGSAYINGSQIPFFLFCIIGIFVCFAWRSVILGAKFWQSYWEQVVTDLQESAGFKKSSKCEDNNCTAERCNAGDNSCEARDFFSPIKDAPHIKARVRKSLGVESSDSEDTIYNKVPQAARWLIFIFIGLIIFLPILSPILSLTFSPTGWPVFLSMGLLFLSVILAPDLRVAFIFIGLIFLSSVFLHIFTPILEFIIIPLGMITSIIVGVVIRAHFNIKSYQMLVLSKPSVSRSMLVVADFFLFVWLIVYLYSIICIFGGDGVKSFLSVPCFEEQCSVNFYELPCETPDEPPR